MKKSLFKTTAAVLCLAISSMAFAGGTEYGKKFDPSKAEAVSGLAAKMGKATKLENVVLRGEITQVCQVAGCWIKMKNDKGEDVFIKFMDHAFAVPADVAGKMAVVHGTAVKKVISVEEQRHLAEDAGASEEEQAKITEPKEELRVMATGIVIEE